MYFSLLPLIAGNQIGDGGIYGLLLGCLGVGGIASVILLPRWRARFSPDRIARVGSIASALLLAALAALRLAVGRGPGAAGRGCGLGRGRRDRQCRGPGCLTYLGASPRSVDLH